MKTDTVNKDYFIIEERYEGTPSHTGVLNVKLPLTNDIAQMHWGQYIGTKTKEDAIRNAELITTAVNACKEINPDNPLNVAKELPDLIHFLEGFVFDVTEGMKVRKDGNSIKKIKSFLAAIHEQK